MKDRNGRDIREGDLLQHPRTKLRGLVVMKDGKLVWEISQGICGTWYKIRENNLLIIGREVER